jgi:glycosyltransferase involved in cell wall biosynthesis
MILRVHYNFDLTGGAEYHVLKLMDVFSKHGGVNWKNYLLLITEQKNGIKLKLHDEDEPFYVANKEELSTYLNELILKLKIKIVHIHSQPSSKITKTILDLGLPTYRSMHEPMIVCPGWSKYWLSEDKPCEISFGPSCLINAYTKKCTKSRNPIHLVKSYSNVKFELNYAVDKYTSIFTCSDYMINEAIKSSINPTKLVKVPSPQYDHFNDEKKQVNSKITIVYSGRLSQQKGVKYLIEAASFLKAQGYDNFQVFIFGKGIDEVYLKRMTEELGLSDVITFFGWVDREVLIDYFKKAHICVIPSTYPDTFPNSVAEAMLAKMAVIAFDSGGTCEWFDHMESGVKIKNKTSEALSKEIENLINNTSNIHNIGEKARAKILANHTLKRTFDVYTQNYNKVLDVD